MHHQRSSREAVFAGAHHRAPRKLPQFQAADAGIAALGGAYVYWAYSADVRGKGGVSQTAIQRQFGMGLYDAPVTIAHACPVCGADAPLTARRAALSGRWGDLSLRCGACGHQTASPPHDFCTPQKLTCSCASCAAAVKQAAAAVAPLAHALGSALANHAVAAAQAEQARLQGLHAGVSPLSYRANVALSLASLQEPNEACAAALAGEEFRHPWDRYDAHIKLLAFPGAPAASGT